MLFATFAPGPPRLLPSAFTAAARVRHAGHSKWHNTRFRKAKQDAVKNAAATRFSAAIRAAVAAGSELTVEDAIARAKQAGVTKDVIDRAVERSRNRGSLQEVLYEGTLGGGVIVLVEALTDNPRKTAPPLRHLFKEAGGALGASGSAAWAFERRGMLLYSEPATDALLEAAMDVGADDVIPAGEAGVEDESEEGEGAVVYCEPTSLAAVRTALAARGYAAREESRIYVPTGTPVALAEGPAREAAEEAIYALTELEDVEEVWHNLAPLQEGGGGG
jgi:YebC/PmpR family DNA-binding regulatory protein